MASTLVSHPPVEAGWGLRYHHRKLQLFKLAEALTPGLPDWQSMQVKFTNESLAEAVDKFNRYTKTAIRIDSQALNAVKVSGVFDLTSPRQFAQSVSSLTGAVIVDKEGELLLTLPWIIGLPNSAGARYIMYLFINRSHAGRLSFLFICTYNLPTRRYREH